MLLLLALILQSSCQSLHHEAHPVFSSSSWDTRHFLFFLILITIFKNTSLVGSYLYNLQVEMDISISPNRSHSVKYTAMEVIIWRQTIQWHLQCGVTTPFTYFQNKFWLKSKTLYLISQKKNTHQRNHVLLQHSLPQSSSATTLHSVYEFIHLKQVTQIHSDL